MPPSHPLEKQPDYCVNIHWHIVLQALSRLGFHQVRPTGTCKHTFRVSAANSMTTIHVPPLLEGWIGADAVQRLAIDLGLRPIDLIIECANAQKDWLEGAERAENRERTQVHGAVPPHP